MSLEQQVQEESRRIILRALPLWVDQSKCELKPSPLQGKQTGWRLYFDCNCRTRAKVDCKQQLRATPELTAQALAATVVRQHGCCQPSHQEVLEGHTSKRTLEDVEAELHVAQKRVRAAESELFTLRRRAEAVDGASAQLCQQKRLDSTDQNRERVQIDPGNHEDYAPCSDRDTIDEKVVLKNSTDVAKYLRDRFECEGSQLQ